MTLIVKFHIKDETFSIEKIVTDMQVHDCSIEVPLLITNHYGFPLVISKTSECFSEGKNKTKQNKTQNDRCKNKKIKKFHNMILFFRR